MIDTTKPAESESQLKVDVKFDKPVRKPTKVE